MRWGENLGAPGVYHPQDDTAPDLSRAVRGASTEDYPEPNVCISGKALDQAIRTPGSNPARSRSKDGNTLGAPRFSPYRVLDAFSSSTMAPVVFNHRIVVFLQIRSNQSNPFAMG